MQNQYWLYLIYLLASVSFIVGLKMLSGPKTARKGNFLAAGGMALAILGTIFLHQNEEGHLIGNYGWIFGGIAIGTVVGWLSAKKVQMTDMPQMVSLFNGMGGACAGLISVVEYKHLHDTASTGAVITILLGLIIGSVSFSGSIIAYLKLQEIMKKTFRLPAQNIFTIVLLLMILGMLVMTIIMPAMFHLYILLILSLAYGVLFVLPIGGADMPVVISLLNSFTGLAAAFGGFLYDNQVMLTGGILVGSAGTLLTILMCNAMNRSLMNVIFGSFGGGNAAAGTEDGFVGTIKSTTPSDVAILMKYAQNVVIVPGYGLAVAQAQHVIHELEELLEKEGVNVLYAIHPVAGRMPGHMNVLLAESNVAYDKLVEMEQINDDFSKTDVVFVVGANDVVNPAARNNPASPIYGMPILNADKAKTVIVSKRSMGKGYAGIENELFGYDNCMMLFGDAKASIGKLVAELKEM
ncbi:MAG TPA: NAD(P)(+) transhydrogenase (Re/Si-specific) subunit beta [Leadbetterella sp.]|nr:NAD(P)(+) transhydrogenase (Re/Si-specific) subunit beta [Leadbetterella sp.]